MGKKVTLALIAKRPKNAQRLHHLVKDMRQNKSLCRQQSLDSVGAESYSQSAALQIAPNKGQEPSGSPQLCCSKFGSLLMARGRKSPLAPLRLAVNQNGARVGNSLLCLHGLHSELGQQSAQTTVLLAQRSQCRQSEEQSMPRRPG